MYFIEAYAITILVETTILFFFLRSTYSTQLIIRSSIIASSVTLPFVWFIFPNIFQSYLLALFLSEFFAVGIEAGIYYKFFPKIKFRYAFALSLLCNLFSFIVGLVFL